MGSLKKCFNKTCFTDFSILDIYKVVRCPSHWIALVAYLIQRYIRFFFLNTLCKWIVYLGNVSKFVWKKGTLLI